MMLWLDGCVGRVLEVNLSANEAISVKPDEKVTRDFLGGLGLGIKFLYDEVGPGVDALSSDNVVVFATGPFSGTGAPTSSRTQVVTKSPLTGIIGTGNFGTSWGPKLKYAGFGAIIIRGRSDRPAYLWINDGVAELRNAEHLWGKDTWDTTDALKDELGNDVSVLAIGQAGENLIRFACPIIDYYRAPGRSHAGAVMGSKRLKAIAVRGTGRVGVADPDKFKEVVKEITDRLVRHPNGERRKIAEVVLLSPGRKLLSGMYTGRNFQTAVVPPDSGLWNEAELVKPHLKRGGTCYSCPIGQYQGCNLVADTGTGDDRVRIGSIECFNAWWHAECGINSFPKAWRCRELCQRYGMDHAGPIPFALELYQRGILTREDTNGLELDWGNENAVMELIRRIAYREGIGDLLAEGRTRAAQVIGKGSAKYAMTIKGLEIYGSEPRTDPTVKRMGVAVNPRGGDYAISALNFPETFSETFSEEDLQDWVAYIDMFDDVKREIYGDPPSVAACHPSNVKGKARVAKWHAELTCVTDSLGTCQNAASSSGAIGPTLYAKLYSACTGWQITPRELMKAGERIYNLMRAYLVREGITRKDDDYPSRFYDEPIPDGPTQGASLDRETVAKLLDVYYETVGWDKETGIPTWSKLLELGLDDAAEDLADMGLISKREV
jgi:aldehyde:ferredoxin oxidoreductase